MSLKIIHQTEGISEIKKAPEGALTGELKRYRTRILRGLLQRRIHVAQIVWRDLVDVIVEPVSKQQIAMAAPGCPRFVLWIVLREIVVRHVRVQTRFDITEIF